ncbi:MAG: aminoacyl-tRNA hydrolase [Bacteroidota bacterium]|jgi:PTH1 family peptidyl-tRNA hydrolase|nr:aminoacyl-tRNA hydrolase [Bacteroidota bacterium]
MKYLLVGLGNPGAEYARTRHNIGFMALDALARKGEVEFKADRLGDVARCRHRGRQLVLLKPSTFMNLSGKAVRHWLDAEKLGLDRLLVVTDDIHLPFGTLRLRGKGSDGGHNGLKDIQSVLGSSAYPRLRFGVGAEFGPGRQVDHVLGSFSAEEEAAMEERLDKVVGLMHSFAFVGLQRTMSAFNNT